MTLRKVVDTCTVINLFAVARSEVSEFFGRYDIVITDEVASETSSMPIRMLAG